MTPKTCKIKSTVYVQGLHGVPNLQEFRWCAPEFFLWAEDSKPEEFRFVTTYTVQGWHEFKDTHPEYFSSIQ